MAAAVLFRGGGRLYLVPASGGTAPSVPLGRDLSDAARQVASGFSAPLRDDVVRWVRSQHPGSPLTVGGLALAEAFERSGISARTATEDELRGALTTRPATLPREEREFPARHDPSAARPRSRLGHRDVDRPLARGGPRRTCPPTGGRGARPVPRPAQRSSRGPARGDPTPPGRCGAPLCRPRRPRGDGRAPRPSEPVNSGRPPRRGSSLRGRGGTRRAGPDARPHGSRSSAPTVDREGATGLGSGSSTRLRGWWMSLRTGRVATRAAWRRSPWWRPGRTS